MKRPARYYIPAPGSDHESDGPYDFDDMMDLLRSNVITTETLTHVEGELDWKPFGNRPQYLLASERQSGGVYVNSGANDQPSLRDLSPIPLPSLSLFLKTCVSLVGVYVVACVVFYFAKSDKATGMCLAYLGVLSCASGQILMMGRLYNDGIMPLLMVLFIPLYDIYYFLVNIEAYFFSLCVKYLGAVVGAMALAGMDTVEYPGSTDLLTQWLPSFIR